MKSKTPTYTQFPFLLNIHLAKKMCQLTGLWLRIKGSGVSKQTSWPCATGKEVMKAEAWGWPNEAKLIITFVKAIRSLSYPSYQIWCWRS